MEARLGRRPALLLRLFPYVRLTDQLMQLGSQLVEFLLVPLRRRVLSSSLEDKVRQDVE